MKGSQFALVVRATKAPTKPKYFFETSEAC